MSNLEFGGRRAYCGQELGHRWHADHFEPVQRQSACNIDKSALSLEEWREKLQRSTDVLARNSPTYRHAVRFGLVQETNARVMFYFEARPHD